MEDIEVLAKKIPFWKELNETEKREVQESCIIKKYKKGANIYNLNNECLGLIVVLNGEIRVTVLSEEGKQITLYKIMENECCVLSASCLIEQITFETEMISEEDSEILILNINVFRKIMKQNIKAKCYIYELVIERFSTVMWVLQEILFLKMDKRIAMYLIKKYNENKSLIIKSTHEQMAKDLGTAREVVTRILRNFENDGMVELRRGNIKIVDIEKLEEI